MESAQGRLRAAEWLRHDETQAIFAALDGAAGRTRAVGGVVRDTILDRQRDNPDIDMATQLLPDEVMVRAKAAGIAVYPTGIDHGTVTLRLGGTLAEVTTLRRDVETDGRHAVVAFGDDWVVDAERRDFTLNALYANADGALFDPLGGLDDCLAGRVRFIGEAQRRIAEDGLRVYRFFRFSASHGGERFDAEGEAACAAAAKRLSHLSGERIGAEMRRMLSLPRIAATLRAMGAIGLLDIAPDIVRALNAYERQASNPDFAGRLALLLDGCPADALQARWRLSNDEMATALEIRSAAALLADMNVNEAIYRFGAVVRTALDIAAARAGWGEAGKAAILERLKAVETPVFPLSGKDLLALGMSPGPGLGAELDRLEREWIESGFTLDRHSLLGRVRR